MWLVNLAGAALIALIVWWFWLYKPREQAVGDEGLVILVENGSYHPAHIKIPANRPTELQFLRKDPSPCAEMVLLPDLEISESLPLDKTRKILLPPMKPGEYQFHCQMQMYRGVIREELE